LYELKALIDSPQDAPRLPGQLTRAERID
jgi:hypothetical protein